VQFSPYLGVYRVNDKIRCTAQGYPAPTVYWYQVVSAGASGVPRSDGPVLRITDEMVGDNTWRCRAGNRYGYTERNLRFRVSGMYHVVRCLVHYGGVELGMRW